MRFSIIVPVYNVREYLEKCVNSILSQEYSDMELILVDDGSTDGSSNLCDSFKEKNEHVKVFHKENGGLSDARNYGIEHSHGDYIIFVDSDDWIEDGCLVKFDRIIGETGVDIIETTLIEAYEDRVFIRDQDIEDFFKDKYTLSNLLEWKLHQSYNTWPSQKMIYSRAFIENNHLSFLKGRLHEDIAWTSNVIKKVKNYTICPFAWYYHRMKRNNSITNSIKAKNITDVIEMAANIYSNKTDSIIEKEIFKRIMVSVYVKIKQMSQCSKEDQKIVIQCIRANMPIFKIAPSLKYKVFVLCMKLFGIEKAVRLLNAVT